MYLRTESGNSSNIKFGGWDPAALAPGADLKMFRTVSTSHWDLKSDDFLMGGKPFLQDVRYISIDPHIPYLYIPTYDWNLFSNAMSENYPDLKCSSANNRCFWSTSCAQI
jgi:hypothetical protein